MAVIVGVGEERQGDAGDAAVRPFLFLSRKTRLPKDSESMRPDSGCAPVVPVSASLVTVNGVIVPPS